MNKKQRKILTEISSKPTPASISWQDIESLLLALGCEKREGRGSRVRFKLNGVSVYIHRPHPKPETNRHTVRDICDFLEKAEVKS